MEVILLERIRNLGDLGQQVKVKAGFGRNFLIPQGKAIPANDANVQQFEVRRAELEARAKEILDEAQRRADKLNIMQVRIEALASDEGKLYGSIGPVEIAHAITEAGEEVLKREVEMPEGPIHEIGEYDIAVAVHSDVTASVKVLIGAGKQEEAH